MEQTAFLKLRNRRDERHATWEQEARASDLDVGQRVRVKTGTLAGLCGVLSAQAADGKWIVDIGEVARGVAVCIRGNQLARI
jgi:hypothetical protein